MKLKNCLFILLIALITGCASNTPQANPDQTVNPLLSKLEGVWEYDAGEGVIFNVNIDGDKIVISNKKTSKVFIEDSFVLIDENTKDTPDPNQELDRLLLKVGEHETWQIINYSPDKMTMDYWGAKPQEYTWLRVGKEMIKENTKEAEMKVENKIWYAHDTATDYEMRRSDYLDDVEKEPELLIDLINEWIRANSRLYMVPRLELTKIQDDTIYVKVIHEIVLTEQMGSTGASQLIDIIVHTLTEIESVNYVDLDFQAGSHALPGKYSREGGEEIRFLN